jgi:hypothetical protein
MDKKRDRKELERRLAEAKRMATEPNDPLTKERLKKLVQELEERFANRSRAASVGGLFHIRPRHRHRPRAAL